MLLWKRLAEIYISGRDRDEIISGLKSLKKELISLDISKEEKERQSKIIKKLETSHNIAKSLENQIWIEHSQFLLNRPSPF
jgi:TnpA family transposase